MSNRWIYLTDLAPKARILNPVTNQVREIMQTAVKDRAPIGLRRYELEELPGGLYRETGTLAPLTPTLVDEMADHALCPNSWNYDHADYHFELQSDEAERAAVQARLEREMAEYPFKFEITGLQRRFLMYFSDGGVDSQKAFESILPTPDRSPLRTDGSLRRPFALTYNHNMKAASVPWPKDHERLYGGLRPCLYRGPAYVVRFLLDDQDVLLERCRVYVDPQGDFICSDWCQRHDFSSYNGGGINLQMGIYTFATWVTGPCLAKNGPNFQPKSTTVERTPVRDLMKRHVLVPTFEDTLAKATKKIAAVQKALPPKPAVVEAGPITADIMAEAITKAQALFDAKPPQPEAPPADTPAPAPDAFSNVYRVPYYEWDHGETLPEAPDTEQGYVIRMTRLGGTDECPVVEASLITGCRSDYRSCKVTQTMLDGVYSDDTDVFTLDAASSTGFWYGDAHNDPNDELSPHWWLHSAAQYYRTHLHRSPIEAALQGA